MEYQKTLIWIKWNWVFILYHPNPKAVQPSQGLLDPTQNCVFILHLHPSNQSQTGVPQPGVVQLELKPRYVIPSWFGLLVVRYFRWCVFPEVMLALGSSRLLGKRLLHHRLRLGAIFRPSHRERAHNRKDWKKMWTETRRSLGMNFLIRGVHSKWRSEHCVLSKTFPRVRVSVRTCEALYRCERRAEKRRGT